MIAYGDGCGRRQENSQEAARRDYQQKTDAKTDDTRPPFQNSFKNDPVRTKGGSYVDAVCVLA